MFTKAYWAATGEQVGAAFVATFLAGVGGADSLFRASTLHVLEVAGGAAVLMLLKCLSATLVGAPDSPALLPAKADPPAADQPAPAAAVVKVQEIPARASKTGGSLGRHVEHDERSRGYAIEARPEWAPALASQKWTRRSPVFNQGGLGSCTGNAAAGWVATDNAARKGKARMGEKDAVVVYEKATTLDNIAGVYPPDDTGSSSLGAAKALRALGYCTGYSHAFSLSAALTALQSGPFITGIAWRTGCDTPDAAGLVRYTGSVRGGHEILCDEIDVENKLVGFTNSWGRGWGAKGRFYMSWDDFGRALADQGDVCQPH